MTTLEELGHTQPPTPLLANNKMADGYYNKTIKPKRSKSMDKRYHWLQDRVRQKQFLVNFSPGTTNLANPFTNHHPLEHCRTMRQKYLFPNRTTTLGCADISLLCEILLW